jgi:Mlc titration factor MtfA (ptsG expression regulator)
MNGLILIIVAVLFLIKTLLNKNKWKLPSGSFPPKWRVILLEKVSFYNALSDVEKNQFEYKVQEFLMNCRITGIEVSVDVVDKLLVASSAVIPIFNFPQWK